MRVTPSLARLAFGAYLFVLLVLTFLPEPPNPEFLDPSRPWAFATPFATIGHAFAEGLGSQSFAVLIGNILAFVPVGILVPLTRPHLRRPLATVLAVGFLLSFAIELGQLLVSIAIGHLYRQADIDDVIANAFGAFVGSVALRAATFRRE